MLKDFFCPIASMVLVVVLSFIYVIAIESRLRRENEETDNLRQGCEKISWEGIPPAASDEP